MNRKVNDFENVRIIDGKIEGLTLSYHFNVRLSEDCNPAVCPNVNCDGMPVSILCKKAWDAMKVSARPSMKKLTEEEMLEVYHQKDISWKVMVSQTSAENLVSSLKMTDSELDAQIERLTKLREENQKQKELEI